MTYGNIITTGTFLALVLAFTYYLQLGEFPNVGRKNLKVIVTQVQSTESGCKQTKQLDFIY